ncbi:hypothetical protein IWX90DRAFT_131044 [Phyllosticta citrichinensis]|uniref:Uncharacterized protein n=1 Tax=Phyllosticta citrichinensis TaxID=1130410 RepID=A0ABR1Y4H1_9PEZI
MLHRRVATVNCGQQGTNDTLHEQGPGLPCPRLWDLRLTDGRCGAPMGNVVFFSPKFSSLASYKRSGQLDPPLPIIRHWLRINQDRLRRLQAECQARRANEHEITHSVMRSRLDYYRALPRAAVCLVSSSARVAMHLPCNCSGIVDEAGLLRQTRNEASNNGRDHGSIVSTRADDKKEKTGTVAVLVGGGDLDVSSGWRQRMTLQCDSPVKQSNGESRCSDWGLLPDFWFGRRKLSSSGGTRRRLVCPWGLINSHQPAIKQGVWQCGSARVGVEARGPVKGEASSQIDVHGVAADDSASGYRHNFLSPRWRCCSDPGRCLLCS